MPELELYSYHACPFAQRTRIVLDHKALEFQLHEVDLANRPADWQRISPYGKVPVLRHRGETIYESAIINQYVDEVFPEPPLMPADPLGRARARIWMDYCDTRLLPATQRLMADRGNPEARELRLAELADVLRFIEHEGLAARGPAGPFWLGDAPGLVDFHYLPFMERLGVQETLAGFAWPDDCPALRRWFDATAALPAVAATLRCAAEHVEAHLSVERRIAARRAAGG